MTSILGISCFYHDAGACLLQDGSLVAAAEEERFTRRKHDSGFPSHAIQYCLAQGGIRADQLDYVAYYEKPFLKFERILHSYIATFPRAWRAFLQAIPVWLRQKLWIKYLIREQLRYKGPLVFVDHHLSHAASAYFVSPFQEAALLTVDGVGEWTTAARGYASGNNIQLTHEIHYPHSLGLLYSAFTAHLGFEVNDGEYKVMGMAPYGQPSYYDQVRRLIDLREDGSFALDMSYFGYHYSMRTLNERFRRLFGDPRAGEASLEQRYADQAASIQKVLEEAMVNAARALHRDTGSDNLCMAGGVALNCVANARVLEQSGFRHLFVQPAAGDSGGCVGAATYLNYALLGNERSYVMNDACLGPSYSVEHIRSFLDGHSIAYTEYPAPEMVRVVAQLLAAGNVVGWFQGRMEFGPRALGSRSILADPRDPAMKDVLNEKIKHREQFRPFAPAVLREAVPDYFEFEGDAPFMLLVARVRPEKKDVIPAVTHLDGTARLQTVTKEHNGIYYDLIAEFGRLTGVPIIINTSFNVRGEPIVCTPEEAYNCFTHTDMDYLALGPCLVSSAAKKTIAAYPVQRGARLVEEVIA